MPDLDLQEDHVFHWGPNLRTPVFGAVPVPGQEVSLGLRRGAVNNCDLYLGATKQWVTGVTTAGSPLIPILKLYRLVNGVRHLLRTVLLTDTNNGVQWQQIGATGGGSSVDITFQLTVARGTACDGFEVTVFCPSGTPTQSFGRPCSGYLYSWGAETSAAPFGQTAAAGGGGGGGGGGGTVQLSTAPLDLQGTATTTPSQISVTSRPTVQGVQLTADPNNTNALLIAYVNTAGVFSQFLLAGDSITLPVANANLIWIHSSSGSQNWLASVYQ